jgi:hypothetical protein
VREDDCVDTDVMPSSAANPPASTASSDTADAPSEVQDDSSGSGDEAGMP